MKTLTQPDPQSVESCVAKFVSQSQRALQICDLLEALADDLPRRQDIVWKEAQAQCKSVLEKHIAFLSTQILPVLLDLAQDNPDRTEILSKLHADCRDRENTRIDLDDLFYDVMIGKRFDSQPEALGYALRGFFDGMRRDLSWELGVLWPMSTRILSQEDLGRIRALGGERPYMH